MRRVWVLCLVLSVSLSLSARENPIAAGFQVGYAMTGSVMDINLDLISVNLSLGIPLGYPQVASLFTYDPDRTGYGVYTISTDVSIWLPLSEELLIKVGIGSITMTDFGPRVTGVVGPVFKAEYWIWESNSALVVTVMVPMMRYEKISHWNGATTREMRSIPGLSEDWLLTSSIGLLYGY
ncbi:hypothetical protein [Sphaerochaeta sp. PS]|uniref:hypothetical protein n=1 Tax=Sphaerochaeta sp. PS TaxID=3076336 RepID=UPI0028A2E8B2|nr:hypothetical protein [Sphaerochaeta sp. PS]MDT4762149.1 hypothetical protein [Sphaerochaeta sp. PS]